MDDANVEQLLPPGSIKVNGKARNLGGGPVTNKQSKIPVTSEVPLSKRYRNYGTKKILEELRLVSHCCQ